MIPLFFSSDRVFKVQIQRQIIFSPSTVQTVTVWTTLTLTPVVLSQGSTGEAGVSPGQAPPGEKVGQLSVCETPSWGPRCFLSPHSQLECCSLFQKPLFSFCFINELPVAISSLSEAGPLCPSSSVPVCWYYHLSVWPLIFYFRDVIQSIHFHCN